MKYKCVIFDCDGVLVDSEAISCSVLLSMAKDLGLTLDWNEAIEEFSGKSLRSIIEYIEARIEGLVPADFEFHFRQKTFEKFKSDLTPIKGIHAVLQKLSVPFCVASSGPRDKIELNLTKTQLIDYFPKAHIFSSFEIGSWKPDPKIYLYAVEKTGFSPKDCAVIEDSIYGVTAAINGGFDTYAYSKKHNQDTFKHMGATVFDDMDMLLDLLEKA